MNLIRCAFCALLASMCVLAAGSSQVRGADRPNILFCIADDASWPHMSAYGSKFVNTPNFDRVAREGILFNNAFTPIPKCSPSRAAILTGRSPWQLEEAFDHNGIFPAKFKVYPQLLEDAGYHVGFTAKGWGPGDFAKGGFKRNPAGPQYNQAKNKPPRPGISPIDYAGNFDEFLKARPKGAPFCFWYGGHEPHRAYQEGSGLRAGKKLADVTVPTYLPDTDVVRSDLLDYALEIEWFDAHLGRILKSLEATGELDNTIIVVTADNGMPFPRVKGHIFEDACHLPLAIRWGAAGKGGRVVDDFVSFTDFAPTFLEIVGLKPLPEMTGRSLVNVLKAQTGGQVDPARTHVLLGRERTDVGRPGDVGFPVRAIRTKEFFYSHNFAPDRWPCGNPETGYQDTDDSPTKRLVLKLKEEGNSKFFDLAMGKRPAEELYDLKNDPACVNNLAGSPGMADVKAKLWAELKQQLIAQQDPRILGNGDVFDHYEYHGNKSKSWDAKTGKKKEAP
jgi:N-sulfoglucosamine sulfohydrolase